MSEPARTILSVSEITRRIKALLEGEVGNVWIEGEVSNFRRPASGHCYFTLKDAGSQIAAVLFRSSQKPGQSIKDGDMVRVYGRATVYERGGNYQILVRTVEEAGKGDLQRRFEELKSKLRDEGLFDESHKKPMPLLPQHVGIVTSRTGAAIRDILNVITRRFPNIHILLAPVKVQGEGAAQDIAEAIEDLNEIGGLDVLIVGRGGGSIEDLWAFNEEPVARAIWKSAIPVISAVGHEIDFTISDFVADLRAPTPSAAAELVIGRKEEFDENLDGTERRLLGLLKQSFLVCRSRFAELAASYVFREPGNLVKQYGERLRTIDASMRHELVGSTREVAQALDDAAHRLSSQTKLELERIKGSLARTQSALVAMNPNSVLKRGYSITKGPEGKCVTSSSDLKKGDVITTVLSDGEIESFVERLKH